MSRPVFRLKSHTHNMIPVYAHKTALGCRPLFLVTTEERKEMLANGSAQSVSRGKALQLLVAYEQFRGQSAQMGPGVTLRAASVGFEQSEPGSGLAQVAALSYLMTYAGSYCPLVLR